MHGMLSGQFSSVGSVGIGYRHKETNYAEDNDISHQKKVRTAFGYHHFIGVEPSPVLITAVEPSAALEVDECDESPIFKNSKPPESCPEYSIEMNIYLNNDASVFTLNLDPILTPPLHTSISSAGGHFLDRGCDSNAEKVHFSVEPSPVLITAVEPSAALEVDECDESPIFKNSKPPESCPEYSIEMNIYLNNDASVFTLNLDPILTPPLHTSISSAGGHFLDRGCDSNAEKVHFSASMLGPPHL
ncbi:hypothetical protein QYM36_011441 [Artemia franciscana]|uniref:Uncharacterized protein n=1 Tax=Artemia franciscana TaxID=6661 RepID=A0AA88HM05_ARTSF|nr:hypothetical protein QYM36_011441 [Artemia franciscana]